MAEVLKVRIYFVSKQANLNIFKSFLPKKFPTISVHGSNSLEVAVEEITRSAPVNPYSMVIVTNQSSVAEDIESGGRISKTLLDASKFVLKDTPIYFMVPAGGKEYSQSIQENFNAPNIRVSFYQGKIKREDIEAVIREVAVTYEKEDDRKQQLRQTVVTSIATQEAVPIGDSYFGQVVLAGISLSDKQDLLKKYSKNTGQEPKMDLHSKIKHLETIRAQINSKAKDNITLEEVAKEPSAVAGDTLVEVNENLNNLISPNAIKHSLPEHNEVYSSLALVKDDIDSAIENIKDEVGQEKTAIELMTAKAEVITKMTEIESTYMVEIADIVSQVTEEKFNSASSLTKLNIKELNLGAIGNDLASIEMKKDLRDNFIKQAEGTTRNFVKLIQDVGINMQQLGESYTRELQVLQADRSAYASEKGIVLEDITLPVSREVLSDLQAGYKTAYTKLDSLMESSKDIVQSFGELIQIDNNIINHQTQVIDTLVKGNVKTVVNVGGTLEAKSITVVGKDGSGKTVIGSSLAKSFSERGMRVAVIDLDSQSPSLHLYTKNLKVGYNVFMQDATIKLDGDNNIAFVVNPSISNDEFDLEKMFHNLNEEINTFDRIIYLVPQSSPSLPEIQQKCKATIYVTNSDVSNLFEVAELSNTTMNITPINTVVVNKCSQQMTPEIANLLTDLQLTGTAVIPVLYYSKFDYCKLKNIEPFADTPGIITVMNQVMSSIE